MKVEVTVGAHSRTVEIRTGADGYQAHIDGETVRLHPAAGAECFRLEVGGRTLPVRITAVDGGAAVTIGAARVAVGLRRALSVPSRRGVTREASTHVEVRAPIAGLVVAVPASQGVAVAPGAPVAIVEAMKMQMEVPAPVAGRIDDLRVRPGQEVIGGQVLVVIACAPGGAGEEEAAAGRAGGGV